MEALEVAAPALKRGKFGSHAIAGSGVASSPGDLPTLDEYTRELRAIYLRHVGNVAKWNVTHAARIAGVNRTAFYATAKRLGIAIPPQGRTTRERIGWRR